LSGITYDQSNIPTRQAIAINTAVVPYHFELELGIARHGVTGSASVGQTHIGVK